MKKGDNMKKGDKIIWDSGFGYEIGYFIKNSDYNMYNTYRVNFISGNIRGISMRSKDKIFKYTSLKISEMKNKYNSSLDF